ncbi:MAG: L-threonylcarbamoyladenylate synthase [Pseudomonadota bacterium]
MDKAVSLWGAGQLVALPTETVYGLGADACNGEAVARIYAVKSRPQFNPLIVHVSDEAMAERYAMWNDAAAMLACAFWPGPVTLVLKRRAGSPISELVSAGGDTIAIRMPAHPVAQRLIAAFDGGIAAPSANRSGRISPTTAQHVRDELGDAIPLIIDGGPCQIGLESTVVDVSGPRPLILRPGSITRAMMEATGLRLAADCENPPSAPGQPALKSPGQLESHYAPSIPVRLNATDLRAGEALLAFGPGAPSGAAQTLNLSATGNLLEAAANLFAHLRALDDASHTAIAIMPIPTNGIGEAINDRLKRAAAVK